jgi:hypothetical protein
MGSSRCPTCPPGDWAACEQREVSANTGVKAMVIQTEALHLIVVHEKPKAPGKVESLKPFGHKMVSL